MSNHEQPFFMRDHWTYDPKAFLKNPVYSRDWPPAKYLEP